MAKMLTTGMNYRQIGEVCGVAPAAVGQRLRRMGCPPVKKPTKTSLLDQDRLVFLYEVERMPLLLIAADFEVSDGVIKRALKLHRIPKRPRPNPGGKHFDRLRKLKIGETAEIECSAKNPQTVLSSTARALGIAIATRGKGSDRFGVTRIDPAAAAEEKRNRKISELARFDKKLLEELFHAQGLSIAQIAADLGCGISRISQALEFHEIGRRPPIWGSGKYTRVFKRLEVGASVELECSTKYPCGNLHTIAKRVGIKIATRTISAGRFRVSRLK